MTGQSHARRTRPGVHAGAVAVLSLLAALACSASAAAATPEVRASLSDTRCVRMMAQVFVAAACDLIGAERHDLACYAGAVGPAASVPAAVRMRTPDRETDLLLRILDERLLDLPPPAI